LILFVVLVVGALSFVRARCFCCCVWFACVHCLWSCLWSEKIKWKTTSTNMEQRTRTITINNARSEAPHHQRKNQELRAKNTFGNNEYRTNTIKH
jgi:hypothetical protein